MRSAKQQLRSGIPLHYHMFNYLIKEYNEPETYVKVQFVPRSKHFRYRLKN